MKLGLSMRYAAAAGYSEDRDALARSWYDFLYQYLPQLEWMPLPNLPVPRMRKHLAGWRPDALLLTGGPEMGADIRRDEAEGEMLRYALDNHLPVLGVCRGFQFIHQYLGGILRPCPAAEHVQRCHLLRLHHSAASFGIDDEELEVNSFHRFGILASELAEPLRPLAQTGGWVEWAVASEPRLMGIMWHPERPSGSPKETSRAIRCFFSNE